MIYIVLAYFSFLLFYFYKRNNSFDLATAITSLFMVSVFCGVLIDVFDLYGEYGVNDKVDSFPATVVFCLGITFVIYPFSKIREIHIEGITLRKPVLFDGLCILLIGVFIAYCLFTGVDGLVEVIRDAASVKSEYYEDLNAIVGRAESPPIYMYPVTILINAWSLVLCLWFYRMVFMKPNFLMNGLLLIASLGGVLGSGAKGGRGTIIYWLFLFFLYFFFFKQFMSSKMKKRIVLAMSILGGIVFLLLIIITVSRFEDSDDWGALFSFIGYAGQMYNNFCSVYEVNEFFPMTLDRIFPLLSKYLEGRQFDLIDFYDKMNALTGVAVNCFTTMIGGLLINVGFIGMVLYMFVYNVFSINIFKRFRGTLGIHQLVLLSYLIIVPVKGLFGLPFTTVNDTLMFVFSMILYFTFKHTLEKDGV